MLPASRQSVASVVDVTQRKQAEALLSKERETFASILQKAPYGVALIDRSGRYAYINPAFTAITGYRLEDIPTGRHWFHKAYPNRHYRRAVMEAWKKDITREGADRVFGVTCKNGSIKQIEFRPTVLDDGRAIVMLSDTTQRERVEDDLRNTVEKLKKITEGAIQTMATIVETRDPYTAGHQQQVTRLACAIANDLGLSEDQVNGIRMAAAIHDIGKIYIPAEILSKPGTLGSLEFAMIREHPRVGYDILQKIEFPWPVADIVLQHHERLDGSGYPAGISGEQLLLEAKIIGVADVVESMSSHRPYRPGLGLAKALREIESQRGVLYDSDIVDVCLSLFKDKGFRFE
jgi:PAS domain S-box-containing protein/putative nucleotidyltransferase with HDIG domain